MQKYLSKNSKAFLAGKKNSQDKSINRFWGNATRLEHVNNRNKNKGKKGN